MAKVPVSVSDFKDIFEQRFGKASQEYLEGAANDGITVRENDAAFKRWRYIQSKHLIEISLFQSSVYVTNCIQNHVSHFA